MAEPITEMYCENCGRRHVFGGRKPGGVARIRRVSRGLRSYVLNEAPTLGDAMADAWTRLEAEGTVREDTALGAAFSLCLECRRYVCHDCWNPAESLCRTCAPTPEDRLASAAAAPPATVDRRPDEPLVAAVEIEAAEPGARPAAVVAETVANVAPPVPRGAPAAAAEPPAAALEEPAAVDAVAVIAEPAALEEPATVAEPVIVPERLIVASPVQPAPTERLDSDVIAAARAAGFAVETVPVPPEIRDAIALPVRPAPGPEPTKPTAAPAPPDALPAVRPVAAPLAAGGAATTAAPVGRPLDAAPRVGGRHRRRPLAPTRTTPSAIRCRACGLHLPAAARFCRRCGVRQATEA